MYFRGLLQFAAGSRLVLPLVLAFAVFLVAGEPTALAATPAGDPEPRKVSLQTEDKLTLVATYYAPHDLKHELKPGAPGVLLVHGAGGSRADLEQLALRLQRSGFAALTLDLRGHGESATEDLTWKKLDADAQKSTWAGMTGDVQAGVDFLLQQPGVQSTAVSLVGQAAGCTLVARHAKRDEKVRDVVLLSPQSEQFGFSLTKDMAELGGLPLFIGAGKDEAPGAKRISEAANKVAGKESQVEFEVAKVDASGLLADGKFTADLTRWMKSKAQPESVVKVPEAKPIR